MKFRKIKDTAIKPVVLSPITELNQSMNSSHGFQRGQAISSNFMKPFQFGAPSTEANGTAKFVPTHDSSINSTFFTNKRVWVRLAHGNPTTIVVHQNDIVDDLKSAIVAKYPNTIGRTYDSADLVIKLGLSSRSSGNSAAAKKPSLSVSPDRKSPISAQFHVPISTRYITLESDQNVYAIIDTHFPNGMTINDALLIELPLSHQQSDQQSPTVAQTLPQVQAKTLAPQTHSPSYYQPKPQYTTNHRHHHLNSSGSIHNFNAYEEMSVSPAPTNAVNRASPLLYPQQSPVPHATVHRRSQSNPPQSPASQAVLLLPKNFSLTNSNNVSSTGLGKKRLSLDENQVKEIHKADSLNSIQNDNVSLNSEVPTPFPMSSNRKAKTLPKLNISDVPVISESASSEMLSSSSGGPNVPVGGLLVPKGYQQLNSPSRTPVTATSKSKQLLEEAVEKSGVEYDNGSHKSNNGSLSGSTDEPNKSTDTVTNSKLVSSNKSNGKVGGDSEKGKASSDSLRQNSRATTTEKVLPSISVLVVEDNAINQAILGAFLRKHKIHYQIAKNGQEAIDKWRKGGFHLVLMDIQLPVKSGIEATKAIRQLEKINGIGVFAQSELNNTTLPKIKDEERLDLRVFRSPVIIVALTASSNSSVDRQNALMAGCNDYLTKPVNLVWLQNKITEWGCMQALIDFEGWKSKSVTFQQGKHKPQVKAAAR